MAKYKINWLTIVKAIFYIFITIVTFLFGKKILEFLGLKKTAEEKKEERIDKANTENTPTDTSKLTRPLNDYKIIADNQYQAMNIWGTNEYELFTGIEGLNTDELRQVFKEFGTRQGMNLTQWYNDELSGDDLEKMRLLWKPTNLF